MDKCSGGMVFTDIRRIFPVLLALSVCITLYMLSWDYISQRINFQFRWTVISRESEHRESSDENNYTPADVLNATNQIKAISDAMKMHLQLTTGQPVKTDSTTPHGAAGPLQETPMPRLFKKDFKKLPHWDFDDVYTLDTQLRQTTCPQPLQKSEDPSFKQAFIPNVHLFMHKEDLNMSEWNRLSHFNNPFGYMQYSHDAVKAAVDLIPKPKEPLLLPRGDGDGCVRCAVVGTAGILNGSGMGKEINAHDYVFRVNAAVIKGYEEDVGNKTSVYVYTAYSIKASLTLFRRFGYKHIPDDEGIKHVMIPEGDRDFRWLQEVLNRGQYKNRQYYAGRFNESRFYVLHPDFLRYVRNRFLKSSALNGRSWGICRPTNGAFTLFLALHTCDVVDAYGFMTEDWWKYANYYMERKRKTKVVFYANHDYIMEMKAWKKLHNAKIMRLYQRG